MKSSRDKNASQGENRSVQEKERACFKSPDLSYGSCTREKIKAQKINGMGKINE